MYRGDESTLRTDIEKRTPQTNSATGTRTRVARVRAEYPNQLDYSGVEVNAAPTVRVYFQRMNIQRM